MVRSNRARALAVLMAFGFVTMGIILTFPSAIAATRTWDTDADFNAGTLSGVEVVGTGTPATVQLIKDATDWKNEAPASNPGAREGPAMAYDSTSNVVVLFGGYNAPNLGDTWVYNPSANTWTNQNPATAPSPRAYAAMSFDASNGTIVLFGGVSDVQSEADTWEYNYATNTWTQTTPPTSPPPMASYSMAYYASAQRTVLAGQNLITGNMETWAYDVAADTWTDLAISFTPARSGHAVAYDAALDRLVLFGGAFLFTLFGDTWEYDYATNSWVRTLSTGSGPSARSGMGLSYRSSDSSVWLFGGNDGSARSDTWRYFDFSGTRVWTNVPTQRSPPARDTFGITDRTSNGKSVIFGGILSGGSRASDTWSLGPAYRSSGLWTSANADSGGANVDWLTLSWSPTTQPSGTILRFQTATSNDPAVPGQFAGPNCDPAAYYTTSGTAICASQDAARYIQVRAQLLSGNNLNTATMDWVSVDYNVPVANPYIILTSPANAELGVAQTVPIFIRFSEPMNIGTVTLTINPTTPVSSGWSEGNSALTLTPSAPLLECKPYTVNITAGQDTGGAPLSGGPVPNPWSFVTQCINPTITATSPVQGDMDVPLTADIVITFSEPMNKTSVGATIFPIIPLTSTWSGGDTILTLSHVGDFTQCMMHTVNITGGKDLAGLALIPGIAPNPFDFHTHCREPYIVSTDPFHLETNVLVTADIVVLFSEPMVPTTVTWTLLPLVSLSAGWTNQNQTLTLSHTLPFTICQTYTANITGGKDADEGLDLFPGQHEAHAPHPWKFTISCPNPFVVVTIPPDGASGVDLLADITVQFSEAMNIATVRWTITPTIPLNSAWDPGNQLLTFTHTTPFGCGVNTVRITDGNDVDGNPLIAGPAPNPWSFQTNCPNPWISQTNPADNATGVLLTADIVVTFNEPMIPGSVTWGLNPTVPLSGSWSSGNTVLTLSHTTPFNQTTTYVAVILTGTDVDGNSLINGPAPNPWRFTSAGINPQILSTNPADGATGVSTGANVIVVFSEPMDTTTLQVVSNPLIVFTFSWSNGNTTVTMGHLTNFAECTAYTLNVSAKDTTGDSLIPGPVPNPWTFTVVCFAPAVTDTNPANAAVDVPRNAPVFVNFSRSMNTATVQATFVPGPVTVTYVWSNADRSVRIGHTALFLECQDYTVTVTGQDTNGVNLGPGPVPNPWTFRTFCPAPQITSTVPADLATNVNPAAPIVVTFSRAMARATVTSNFVPSAGVTPAWSGGDTILTLTPNPALAQCTMYTVTIGGKSADAGKDLVAGPVPNPWTFNTQCFVAAPGNLQVSRAAPNVHLTWNAVPNADSYTVYESQDRFAAWPWGVLGTTTSTAFDATPHLGDGLTHYYIVRAVRSAIEGTNSTMGVKISMSVGFSSTTSNIRWFSLPYRSGYARASDIASELGPTRIDVVAKWNPATQSPILYYYFRGAWRGTDFTISAGDGLYIGVRSSFSWVIVGTDRASTLSFTVNVAPLGNVNWLSIPYTGTYARASDLVRDIEGNTGPTANTKILEVVKWDPATQALVRYFWTAGGWSGTDFTISPGDGVYFRIVSSFTWQPDLVTVEVP